MTTRNGPWDTALTKGVLEGWYEIQVPNETLKGALDAGVLHQEAIWRLIRAVREKWGVVLQAQDCDAVVAKLDPKRDKDLIKKGLSRIIARWNPDVNVIQIVGGPRDGQLWQVAPGTTSIRIQEQDLSRPRGYVEYVIPRGGWSPASRVWLYPWDARVEVEVEVPEQ